MKKVSKISVLGILAGIFFSVYSFFRYYLGLVGGYLDTDKAAAYVVIGILIISVSYLYERLKQAEFKIDAVEVYLSEK